MEAEKLKEENKNKKEEEVSVADNEAIKNLENTVAELRSKEDAIIEKYASTDKKLRQLIDLSLLANNMLKGEALNNFIKRSTSML